MRPDSDFLIPDSTPNPDPFVSTFVLGTEGFSSFARGLSWAQFTAADSDNSAPTSVPEPTALLGLSLAIALSTLSRRKQNQ